MVSIDTGVEEPSKLMQELAKFISYILKSAVEENDFSLNEYKELRIQIEHLINKQLSSDEFLQKFHKNFILLKTDGNPNPVPFETFLRKSIDQWRILNGQNNVSIEKFIKLCSPEAPNLTSTASISFNVAASCSYTVSKSSSEEFNRPTTSKRAMNEINIDENETNDQIFERIEVDINQDKMKSADFIDGFIYSMCRSCLETDDRFNLKSLLKRIPLLCVIITEELEFEAADTFKDFIIQYNLLNVQPIILKILISNNVISEQILQMVFDMVEIRLNSMQKSCPLNNQIQKTLLEIFQDNSADNECIIEKIESKFSGIETLNKEFVTAVVVSMITSMYNRENIIDCELLKQRIPILNIFIRKVTDFEEAALIAIKSFDSVLTDDIYQSLLNDKIIREKIFSTLISNDLRMPNSSNCNNKKKIKVEEDDTSCPLCITTLKQIKKENINIVAARCGHIFCQPCLDKYLSQNLKRINGQVRCPVCGHLVSKSTTPKIFL